MWICCLGIVEYRNEQSWFHFGMLCTGGIWSCGVVLFEVLVGCVAAECGYPTRGSSRVKRGRVMVLKTDELCCDGKLRYGAGNVAWGRVPFSRGTVNQNISTFWHISVQVGNVEVMCCKSR